MFFRTCTPHRQTPTSLSQCGSYCTCADPTGCCQFWQSCWGTRTSENIVQLGPSTELGHLWWLWSQTDAHVGKCGQERGEQCRTWGTKPQWNKLIYTNVWETKKLGTWHHTHGQAKQYWRPGLRWNVARTHEGEETLWIFPMAVIHPVKSIIS